MGTNTTGFERVLKEADFTTAAAKSRFANYQALADSLAQALTPPPQTNPRALQANLFKNTATKANEVIAAGNLVENDVKAGLCSATVAGCFAAGTKLWTPAGYRNVEEIRVGDEVFSRDQFDPAGLVEARVVEKIFMRLAEVMHLHVAGQTIRTTAEHPFYAYEKGWTPADELTGADWILTETGDWKRVEEAYATGELETVYNIRVAEHHTYFVGAPDWGWAAWSHNTACLDSLYIAPDDSSAGMSMFTAYFRTNGTKWRDASGNTIAKNTEAEVESTLRTAISFPPGAKITNVKKRNEMDWQSQLMAHSSDARAKTKTAADSDYTTFKNGFANFAAFQTATIPNSNPAITYGARVGGNNYPTIHAHHIVTKAGVTGNATSTEAVRQSHLILRTVGIDPWFARENLSWAPMWARHANSALYRTTVYDRLNALGIPINDSPTDQSIQLLASRRSDVADILRAVATDFINAQIEM